MFIHTLFIARNLCLPDRLCFGFGLCMCVLNLDNFVVVCTVGGKQNATKIVELNLNSTNKK